MIYLGLYRKLLTNFCDSLIKFAGRSLPIENCLFMKPRYHVTCLFKSLMLLIVSLALIACADSERTRAEMQSALQQQSESRKIVEFFMYTCPHCKAAEPAIKEWQARQSVLFQQGVYAFEQIPAVFPANWLRDGKLGEREAALFYTFKRMGLEPQLRMKLFAAIQDKSLDASDTNSLQRFLTQEGVAYAEFLATIKSQQVRQDVLRAEQLTLQYAVRAVPAFVLFNRNLILPQDYTDQQGLQALLMEQVKRKYQSQKSSPASQAQGIGGVM